MLHMLTLRYCRYHAYAAYLRYFALMPLRQRHACYALLPLRYATFCYATSCRHDYVDALHAIATLRLILRCHALFMPPAIFDAPFMMRAD